MSLSPLLLSQQGFLDRENFARSRHDNYNSAPFQLPIEQIGSARLVRQPVARFLSQRSIEFLFEKKRKKKKEEGEKRTRRKTPRILISTSRVKVTLLPNWAGIEFCHLLNDFVDESLLPAHTVNRSFSHCGQVVPWAKLICRSCKRGHRWIFPPWIREPTNHSSAVPWVALDPVNRSITLASCLVLFGLIISRIHEEQRRIERNIRRA